MKKKIFLKKVKNLNNYYLNFFEKKMKKLLKIIRKKSIF